MLLEKGHKFPVTIKCTALAGVQLWTFDIRNFRSRKVVDGDFIHELGED